MPASNDIVIDTFRPADQEAFAELNRAWLTEYGLLEAPDERQLVNPVQEIIGPAARSFWPGATARWSWRCLTTARYWRPGWTRWPP